MNKKNNLFVINEGLHDIFRLFSTMILEDTEIFKIQRNNLVMLLRKKGITDENVLAAIEKVPRHNFMNVRFLEFAYYDHAYPIDEGQTISQPYTVAFQTQLIEVQKKEKILEIGTGSGYQTAVLAEMGAKVYTVEQNKILHEKAKKLLSELGYKAHFFLKNGFYGLPLHSPFDKIIVTAAYHEIPKELLKQLKENGKLVMPVGNYHSQCMILAHKTTENKMVFTSHGSFYFVPLIR